MMVSHSWHLYPATISMYHLKYLKSDMFESYQEIKVWRNAREVKTEIVFTAGFLCPVLSKICTASLSAS